ncbi:MAG: type II toxin-antitoxin system HipA family toxin [Nitrospinae bacterium]|jgi:serine/threonine-protein kinase HipA|nr:type II toxin-antitoxin system HipA family toxin [Nitrospinota bacterium]MDA1110173.1 type II toxin-antitoxin system HipA family toxin [Nitrospinota bacterium]
MKVMKKSAKMKFDLKNINALGVYLGNRRIGIINRLTGDRHIFSFEQDYIDDPNRPTLSLSFKGQTGDLVTSIRPVTKRLPPFFSNLLPEGHLRTYLAKHAGVNEEREFLLLAALGSDLPGAITVKPLEIELPKNTGEKADSPDQENEPFLRFSLAGVQLKFSAIMESSGGLTIPAGGSGGSWIVKLPSMRFPSVPENEYAMMRLARLIGINVPEVRLVSAKDIQGLPKDANSLEGNALGVKRFDRGQEDSKTHMEDFAQVFGVFPDAKYKNASYANIASVLQAEAGEDSINEFIRRLVFSIMIGNADMHLKNWSLLYPDSRAPILSPAYDLVSTIPYLPDDGLALTFGRSRSLKKITKDQVRRFADKAGLAMSTTWALVNETAAKTVDSWALLEEKDLLPNPIKKAIEEQIHSVVINN